jgi:single-strand DNA-binding protein
MPSINKVMLMGNLTRDPELKYTPKGTAVADLSLAINRAYTTDAGEKREEVTFVDVTFFGRAAEIAEKYLTKGKPIFVEGRLHLEQWEDKTSGQKRSKLKVVGESLQMLGSRSDAPEQSAPPSRPQPPAGRTPPRPPGRTQPDPEIDPIGDGDEPPF